MEVHKIKLKRLDLGDEGCHLFCKGKIHGKRVRVLVDTGASKSVISKNLADKLQGLQPIEMADNETSGIGPEKVVAEFVKVRKFSLNDLVIKHLIVGIVDLDHVTELYHKLGFQSFDVILGGDVLDRYKARIDYKKKRLTLHG